MAAAAPAFDGNSPLDAEDRKVLGSLAGAPPANVGQAPVDAEDHGIRAELQQRTRAATDIGNSPLDAEDQRIMGALAKSSYPRPRQPDVVLPPPTSPTAPAGPGGAPAAPAAPGGDQPASPPSETAWRPSVDPRTGHVLDPTTGLPMFAGHPQYAAAGAGEARYAAEGAAGVPLALPGTFDEPSFWRGGAENVQDVFSGQAGANMAGAGQPEPRYTPQVDPQTRRVVDPGTGTPFMPGQPHAAGLPATSPQRIAGQALEVGTPALQGAKAGIDPLVRLSAIAYNPLAAWIKSGYQHAGREYEADPARANVFAGFLRGTLSEEGARAALAGFVNPQIETTAAFSGPGIRNIPIFGMKPGSPEDELMRGVLNMIADVPVGMLADLAATKGALPRIERMLEGLGRIAEAKGFLDLKVPLPEALGGPRSVKEMRAAAGDNRELAHMIGAAQGRSGQDLRDALAAKIKTAKDINALKESGVPLWRTTTDGRKVNVVDELMYHYVEAGTEGAKYADRSQALADAKALGGPQGERVAAVVQRNGDAYSKVWQQTGQRLENAGYLKPGTVEAMGGRYAARMYQATSHNPADIEAWTQAAQEINQATGGKFGLSERAIQLGQQLLGRPGEGGGAAGRAKARTVPTFAEREARGGEFQASPIFSKSIPGGSRIAERQEVLGAVAGSSLATPGHTETPQEPRYAPEDLAKAQTEVAAREAEMRRAQADLAAAKGQPVTPGVTERRVDAGKRKAIEAMTPEEARVALRTDPMTGLGNKRAWEDWHGYEDETGKWHPGAWEQGGKKEQIVSVDADSLKWVNDNYGHGAGDAFLKAVGEALKKAGLDADFFHVSGDEFYGRTTRSAETDARLQAADEWLKQQPFYFRTKNGEVGLRGMGISHGIGTDFESAEASLKEAKSGRESSGVRAGRGERPPGLVEEPAQPGAAATQPAGAVGADSRSGVGADRGEVRPAGGGAGPAAAGSGASGRPAGGAARSRPEPGDQARAAGAARTAPAPGGVAPEVPLPVQNMRNRVSEAEERLFAAREAAAKSPSPDTAAELADARFHLKSVRSIGAQMEKDWRASVPRAGETPEQAAVRGARQETQAAQESLTAAKKAVKAGGGAEAQAALDAALGRVRDARASFETAATSYRRSKLAPGSLADRYATSREAAVKDAQAALDQAMDAHAADPTPENQAALDRAGADLRKAQRSYKEGLTLSDAAITRRYQEAVKDSAIKWANANNAQGRIERGIAAGPPTTKTPVPVPPGARLLTGKQYGPLDGMIVPNHTKQALDAYLAPAKPDGPIERVAMGAARFFKSQAMFLNLPSLLHKTKYDTVLSLGAMADAGLPANPATLARGLAKAGQEYRAWKQSGTASPAIEALDKNTRAMLQGEGGELGESGSSLRNAVGEKPPNMPIGLYRKLRDLVPRQIGEIERTYKIALTEALAPKLGYEEAARVAQETISGASVSNPIYQNLDKYGGIPFLTARARALPRLARMAVTHPGILRQASGLPLSAAMTAAQPPDVQARAGMLGPGAIPLPGMKDDQGRQRFITRNPLAVNPAPDIWGLFGGIGGPVGAAVEAGANVDFGRSVRTGEAQSITKPGELPPLDAMNARIQYVEDRLLPSYMRSAARVGRAVEGTTQYGGPYQEPETLTDAILGITTGAKLGTAETAQERKQRAQLQAGPAARALSYANGYYAQLESGKEVPPHFPFLDSINDLGGARAAFGNAKARLKAIATGQQYKGQAQLDALQRQVAWIFVLQNRYLELAHAQMQLQQQVRGGQ